MSEACASADYQVRCCSFISITFMNQTFFDLQFIGPQQFQKLQALLAALRGSPALLLLRTPLSAPQQLPKTQRQSQKSLTKRMKATQLIKQQSVADRSKNQKLKNFNLSRFQRLHQSKQYQSLLTQTISFLLQNESSLSPKQQLLAKFYQANSHAHLHNLNDAISVFTQSLKLIPHDPLTAVIHNNLGLLYLKKNQFQQSLHNFKKVLRMQSQLVNISQTYFGIAKLYELSQMYEQAAQFYQLCASSLQPDNCQLITSLVNKGNCLQKCNLLQQAFQAFNKTIQLLTVQNNQIYSQTKHYCFLKLAIILRRLKKAGPALLLLSELLDHRYQRQQVLKEMVQCYKQLGDEESRAYYNSLLLRQIKQNIMNFSREVEDIMEL